MITVENALALEDSINHATFQGMPMGGTLNQLIMTRYLCRRPSVDAWTWLRTWLSVSRKGILPFPKTTPSPMPTGCYCFTSIGSAAKFTGLIAPLIGRVSPREVVLMVGSGQRCDLPVHPSRRVLRSRYLDFDRASWRRSFRRVYAQWRSSVATFLYEGGLSPVQSIPIMGKLALQSQLVLHYRNILRHLQPRVIITEYDRNEWASCLVQAAHTLGIPTVTLVHGIICFPFGYTPVLADAICCWGEAQRAQLLRYGVSEDRIEVTGDPRFSAILTPDVAEVRRKLGISSAKPLVVLATNPIDLASRLLLAEAFALAFESGSDCIAGLRLHASEDPAFYKQLQRRFPHLRVWGNGSLSVNEAVAAADVVVAHSSSFMFDAVFRGRPVVVFSPSGMNHDLDNVRDLLGSTSTPSARTARALQLAVQSVLGDAAFRRTLVAEYEVFRERYVAHGGSEAADLVMACVGRVTAGRTPPIGTRKGSR